MTLRRFAIAVLAAPLLAGCWGDLVTDETMETRPDPSGGELFRTYVAVGTSLGAGIESGGINDSTQRETYTYRLAVAMGLTPGVDWHYPSFTNPGCPPPYTNILTGTRVTPPGFPTSTGASCYVRDPASATTIVHNVSVPSIRAAQVLNILDLTFPGTDSLKLVQFITGSLNPIEVVRRAQPTFVTLEIGANDVLGAATRGTNALLTPLASFQSTFTQIADRIDGTGASVAVMNVPNVTVIPHFTRATVLFCLKTGACPGVPATLPYSSPLFTVNASCAPGAAGGLGDTYLLSFTATATITSVLAGGGAAALNCATDVATVTTAAGTGPAGPTINPTEYAAITQRVTDINAFIATEAASRGWALVDIDAALTANLAQIPPIPQFTTPTALFGPIFSLDGIHPNGAGYRLMAQAFAAAINAEHGTSLTVP
ncbi:MAG: SGNH/GDSL hydrolase family protein [Gemmatimonadetes bacterium]|nr:SGNH/GDSL hydrolase family protein [Gemmatimonadota bacterium]